MERVPIADFAQPTQRPTDDEVKEIPSVRMVAAHFRPQFGLRTACRLPSRDERAVEGTNQDLVGRNARLTPM